MGGNEVPPNLALRRIVCHWNERQVGQTGLHRPLRGAGFSRVKGTGVILKGSPLLALTVAHPFDKYIFCEDDGNLLDALKVRTKRISPNADVVYVPGKCDFKVDDICAAIPRASSNNKVLSLCLADPFDFGLNLRLYVNSPVVSWTS